MEHKNFDYGQKVTMHGTGNEHLDGFEAFVVGCSSKHVVDFYIVMPLRPIPDCKWRAFTLPESLLDI